MQIETKDIIHLTYKGEADYEVFRAAEKGTTSEYLNNPNNRTLPWSGTFLTPQLMYQHASLFLGTLSRLEQPWVQVETVRRSPRVAARAPKKRGRRKNLEPARRSPRLAFINKFINQFASTQPL